MTLYRRQLATYVFCSNDTASCWLSGSVSSIQSIFDCWLLCRFECNARVGFYINQPFERASSYHMLDVQQQIISNEILYMTKYQSYLALAGLVSGL
jgi:hypothetical protein